MSNLVIALMETAERYPQRVAVQVQGEARTLTYAELDELSARAAGGLLDHGVRPGDRVGLRLPYSPAFTVLYFGALRAGAVTMPMHPEPQPLAVPSSHDDIRGARLVFAAPDTMSAQEIGAHDTRLVPVGAEFLDQVVFWTRYDGVVDRADHDPAAVFRTGDPAGAAGETTLSHGTLRDAALTAGTLVGETAAEGERAGAPAFSYTGPAYGLTALILSGACLSARGAGGATGSGGGGEPRPRPRPRPRGRRSGRRPGPADEPGASPEPDRPPRAARSVGVRRRLKGAPL